MTEQEKGDKKKLNVHLNVCMYVGSFSRSVKMQMQLQNLLDTGILPWK